jgi:hypothetical protein
MARFLQGSGLNAEIENLFKNANSQIVLISPFIKLHERYRAVLLDKKDNPDFRIIVVFGKNDEDYARSMGADDFNFFKQFPNISIRYENRLHAKYYANESASIITSMNLYSYSQDNNIEVGVLSESKRFSTGGLDEQAFEYFDLVVNQSQLLYRRTPKFEKKFLGLSTNYLGSTVETDQLSDFFASAIKYEEIGNSRNGYKKQDVYVMKHHDATKLGYCIRTGKQIPFNPDRPMGEEAYLSWRNYSNKDYAENFCHFSGEPSNGQTSYGRPILRKYWHKAKETHNL